MVEGRATTTSALSDDMVDQLARLHGVDLDNNIDFDPHTKQTAQEPDDDEFDSDDEPIPGPAYQVFQDQNQPEEVALTAMSLGVICGIAGLIVIQSLRATPTGYWQLPLYVVSLTLFHFLEYYITARYNRPKVKTSSFLLRNGTTYVLAHTLALSEALLEHFFFLSSKGTNTFWYKLTHGTTLTAVLGLLLLVAGQFLRSAAMIHASTNFSHVIARSHQAKHVLVQTGVYSFSRHPSYSGFFFWALGTQILLANPISFVFFSIALWRFFSERIQDEELYLLVFFGREYAEYKKTTPTRIPFIK